MASDFDVKDRVRQAVDIVDLMGAYLELRREGRGYKALCPWHDDHKPSLQINPERQSYKCWVCGEGGDVFSFMMKKENVSFGEALTMLAERAGIDLKTSGKPGGPNERKADWYKVMAWAVDLYVRHLHESSEAEVARKYLDDRGLNEDSIARFRLGSAPDDWEWLVKKAQGVFRPQLLEQVGLTGQRQNSPGFYDRFRGRVLFPIHDLQGRPVALGGRVLPGQSHPAKYINSPETPLFSKSSLLYGLDLARDAASKSREVVVMEGYTDVIAAHQTGVRNAVAVLGTALTERHLPLLKRFADRVVLVLDGDTAGRQRANDLLQLFIGSPLDLRVLTLPDELDPCDFLFDHGLDAFQQLLAAAPDALEHKFQAAVVQAGGGAFAQTEAIREMLELLAGGQRPGGEQTAERRLKEEQILNRMAHRFGVGEASLRDRLSELRRGRKTALRKPRPLLDLAESPKPEAPAAPVEGAAWERELLSLVLQDPSLLPAIRRRVGPDHLQGDYARILFLKCCDLYDEDETPTFERMLVEYEDPGMKRWLVDLDQPSVTARADSASRLDSLMVRLERIEIQQTTRNVRQTLSTSSPDDPCQADALRMMLEHKRDRMRWSPGSGASGT